MKVLDAASKALPVCGLWQVRVAFIVNDKEAPAFFNRLGDLDAIIGSDEGRWSGS